MFVGLEFVRHSFGIGFLSIVLLVGTAHGAEPVGTAFTYQGELEHDGILVNDTCDFEFTLWDDIDEGNQEGVVQETVDVAQGRFTAVLDFGEAIFTGEARWLRVAVCCPSPCDRYITLAPRQELTPTPYSLHAASAPWSGLIGVPEGFADEIDDDIVGALTCDNSQIAKWNGADWVCAEDEIGGALGTIAEFSEATTEVDLNTSWQTLLEVTINVPTSGKAHLIGNAVFELPGGGGNPCQLGIATSSGGTPSNVPSSLNNGNDVNQFLVASSQWITPVEPGTNTFYLVAQRLLGTGPGLYQAQQPQISATFYPD